MEEASGANSVVAVNVAVQEGTVVVPVVPAEEPAVSSEATILAVPVLLQEAAVMEATEEKDASMTE